MRNLVLTGFMGTGKTTVGRLLADRYGLDFVDTDEEVEREAGSTISDLWREQGEDRFRSLEADVFESALSRASRIIATGGGTLIGERNRVRLSPDDLVISLSCKPEELMERWRDGQERPLLAEAASEVGAAADEILRRRLPIYSLFEQLDVTGMPPDAVADKIATRANLSVIGTLAFPGERRSEILLAHGLINQVGELLRERLQSGKALLISDRNVEQSGWLETVAGSLAAAGLNVVRVVLPAGESQKSLETVQRLYRVMMEARLDRSSVMVGVGGGVIGDIAAFAAATYLRGLKLVLVPTTLLAQVDAAVGGKAAVDLDDAKNLVGAFYPADLVIADPDTLGTLATENIADGMAEIVKIAAMRSEGVLEMLEDLPDPRSIVSRAAVIRRAIQEKIRLVQADPYDRGERALLNFGHTVGHALEAAAMSQGEALSHGQAVAIGMLSELQMAEERGYSRSDMTARLRPLLARFGLPSRVSFLNREAVSAFLAHDKKRIADRLRFAFPVKVGAGAIVALTAADGCRAVDYATGEAG